MQFYSKLHQYLLDIDIVINDLFRLMKSINVLLVVVVLLFQTLCLGQTQEHTKIDFIVTNDYMSERNLSLMGGPIPVNYKKEIKESLRNSFVEFYDDNNNIIAEKYYNKIGALYHTNQNFYDSKNRLEKTLEIDEFKNDTCVIQYQYTDSLNLVVHKQVSRSCSSNFLDFYYSYNEKGQKIKEVLHENNTFLRKKVILEISKNERQVSSYDQANRLSNYQYKYNDKDLLIYEKRKEWDYVQKGEYFEIIGEYEYLYQYDKNGNWIERIKQTYCPAKKKVATSKKVDNKKSLVKTEEPKLLENIDYNCEPEIKEKLIRKIYYK